MAHRTWHRRALAAVVAVLLPLIVLSTPATADPADPAEVATETSLTALGGIYTGRPITLTATVTAEDESTPVGTVVFGGSVPDVEVPLGPDGTAQVEVVPTQEGLNQFTADFHGAEGYADSQGATQAYFGVEIVLTPEPYLLKLSFPRFGLTLNMAAYVHDNMGNPQAGDMVTFSTPGALPSRPPPGPGGQGPEIICTAIADANGYATCAADVLGLLLGSLGNPVWVTWTPAPGVGSNFYRIVPPIG